MLRVPYLLHGRRIHSNVCGVLYWKAEVAISQAMRPQ